MAARSAASRGIGSPFSVLKFLGTRMRRVKPLEFVWRAVGGVQLGGSSGFTWDCDRYSAASWFQQNPISASAAFESERFCLPKNCQNLPLLRVVLRGDEVDWVDRRSC